MSTNKIINKSLVYLYKVLPKDFKHRLGKSKWLKCIRGPLLYSKGAFNETSVFVNRKYGNYDVNFEFHAAIKIASAAKHSGIENTILRNSFTLIDTYKPNRIDLNVIDIGANFGYLSTVWTSSIAQKGMTIAFEPNKNIFECVEQTITSNNLEERFKVFNRAVGNANKIITLNVSPFSSNSKEMDVKTVTYTIEMVTLDAFLNNLQIKKVDLIKIDVDGIELDILKGSINTLKNNDTIVIVETNDDMEIITFFESIDYKIFDMRLNSYEASKPIPLNIFCIPNTVFNNVI